jgi:hypothetical protein
VHTFGGLAAVVAAMIQLAVVMAVVADFLRLTLQSVQEIQFSWRWEVLEDLVPAEPKVKEQDQLAVD